MNQLQEQTTEQLDQARLVNMIVTASVSVFQTMLGMDVVAREPFCNRDAPGPTVGVLALIGFAGRWSGTGTLACNSAIACKIADALFMSEHTVVEDEVLDAVAEMANMILGNVKTELEDLFGTMYLSVPTVVYGRNFTTRSLGKKEWIVVPFDLLGDQIEIRICLIPNTNEGAVASFSKTCSLHF